MMERTLHKTVIPRRLSLDDRDGQVSIFININGESLVDSSEMRIFNLQNRAFY